jgi:tetratricopeptide (TPR) repeat protein
MRFPGRALPWVLFLLALAIRIAFVEQYRANPLFTRPIIDARTYHEWALRIATGRGFGEGAFTRAPGYPAFLAAIYGLSEGRSLSDAPAPEEAGRAPALAPAERAIIAAKRVQAVLGALSALLLFLAASRLFDRRVGAIAAALFALHPVLVFYTGELFVETLAIFLLLAAFLSLVIALDRGGAWFLAAGLSLGLAVVTRPTFLPLAAALPLLLAATRRPASRGLRESVLLAAGLAAAIAPVTVRNARRSGDLVLVASQGGVNLWIGNNPMTDGKTALSPGRGRTSGAEPDADIIDVASRQIAEQELGRTLTAGEVSGYWGRKAKAWMREHPRDFALLLARKVGYLCGGAEIWDQQCDVDFLSRFSPVLRALLPRGALSIPTGIIMPFALAGIVIAARGLRRTWPLLWFLLAYAAAALAFSITSRYRLPALPFLFVLAALAAVSIVDRWRSGGARAAAPIAAAVAALAIPVNLHARYPNPLLAARGRVFVANALLERGRHEKAIPFLEEAMRLDPSAADPWYALGMARHAANDRAGARRAFEDALARDPGFERARVNLGNLLAEAGDWEGAIEQYSLALDLLPGDELVLGNLRGVAREAGAGGAPALAERALRRLLVDRPDDVDALNALAWNLADRLGRPEEATPLAERAAALRPGAAEIEDTLGWALGLSGSWADALPHLRAAHAGLPENPDVALHYGIAIRRARGAASLGRDEERLAGALLDAAFAAPGGDARRARAAALLSESR